MTAKFAVMELDRAKLEKAQRAKWRAIHLAGADGKCVQCGRPAPCPYATAGLKSPDLSTGEKP